jgi:hypothetical protein
MTLLLSFLRSESAATGIVYGLIATDLIGQMDWMLGRGYRSGCCAQSDRNRKDNS